jgi:tetratricopeptide (TPR) repeat protein
VLIEEPIPAGTSVDRESIAGGFVHYEIRPDKIVFLVESTGWYTSVRYDLFGVVPGFYRVLPTRVVGAYDPAYLSTGKEASLEVLDKGALSSDPYRVTPDEAYELGRREFDKKAYKNAAASLEKLLAGHGEQYTVRDDIYKEIVRMLLFVALDAKQSDKVVRYFEILKEKYPDLVVPLDKSVEIGAAYIAMRDFERGLQVLKATTEASFNVDSQVGGALDSNGEVAASAQYMRNLLAVYPDVQAVQNATYGLAQHLADLAKRAHEDEALKKQKLQKVGLLDDAIRVFWEFMGLYPENPTTDEAAFALSNTYLSREAHTETMGLTERFRKIFPTSSYLDAYEYIQALAAFALEKYGEAMRLCRQVAEGKYFNERKEKVESTNKDLAVFIMGQIHHALGEAAKALDRYKAIEEKFPDAREAIQNFQRVAMTVPEVTTVKPGELTQVKVSFRNVTDAALTVYKVDLMKLYLIHRDLNNITKVNLAGIKPLIERTVKFSDKPLYRDTQKTIDVAVGGKGAYLVVLKAKEVEASGMLLVSDLKLEVKEDAGAGRVRVQVLDSASSKPVRKVFVRVVGSGDGRFRGDTTDLRGVFNADGVSGRATVIAAKGTSYAFYRGQKGEGATTTDVNTDINAPAAAPAKAFDGLQFEIMKRNIDVQQRVKQGYEQQLRNETKGVQVDMAK